MLTAFCRALYINLIQSYQQPLIGRHFCACVQELAKCPSGFWSVATFELDFNHEQRVLESAKP